jgi:OHCU decarboxylase
MNGRLVFPALDALDRPAFVAALGDVFEHSPWVAEQSWERRPFGSVAALHRAMVAVMRGAGRERQLALIRAHPELGGAAAQRGGVTAASRREQASAGLGDAGADALAELRRLNEQYQQKFGFPFVLAVARRSKPEILAIFKERLGHAPEEEFARALDEIARIAELRLEKLVRPTAAGDGVSASPALGPTIMGWADALAAVSEEPGRLTRTFLTPQHRAAGEKVIAWMRDAGMSADFDAIGNVAGRYEGREPGQPALLLGSHLDTVRDAGRYDGMLGVLSAIACVGALHRAGERLPFAIEVIGFGDEEGVRFQSTLIGSRAVGARFDASLLERRDAAGISLAEALRRFGSDPAHIGTAARRPEQVLAYVELHIEQGPVLEAKGLPLGIVTSIAGASRYAIAIAGEAGHAGTVPMALRRDALAAAAEAVLVVERRCAARPDVVGTVGQFMVTPGAINVIPGAVQLSLDIRAPTDMSRRAATEEVLRGIEEVCRRRGVSLQTTPTHDGAATACAPWLMAQIQAAVVAQGVRPLELPSGAGHDAMALAALCDVGMLFVRCKGGISHNPAESITAEDAEIGARALLHFIRHFTPAPRDGIR